MPKQCKRCGVDIEIPTRGYLLCLDCYKTYNREKTLKWQKENPEKERDKHRRWRLEYPSKYTEQELKWRKSHKDIINKIAENWRRKNPERSLELHRASYQNHRVKNIRLSQAYQRNHPDATRLLRKKHQFKRQKELGYIPLNLYFKSSNGHHIDSEKVIYIPESMHKQYPHNHKEPDTMQEINKIAFNFLFGVHLNV